MPSSFNIVLKVPNKPLYLKVEGKFEVGRDFS